MINIDYAHEIIKTNTQVFNLAWFGRLTGSAQLFVYLIQIDAWLREYRVRIKI